MSINPEQITICTTNMNRNNFLVRSLSTWVDRGFKEIVIVDWNSEKPFVKDLRSQTYNTKNIKIIRVNDQPFFNCTKSRNLAAEFCTTPYIWFMDGDVRMTFKDSYLSKIKSGHLYHGALFITGAATTGSCLMEKKIFDEVNGYSELITTLPGEDLDLYKRIRKTGYKIKFFAFGSIEHIPHPYALRTKYRPWYGLSRAEGTRITFKQVAWNKDHKQLKIPYDIITL
jgi:predicted glycosyltransferase involved in capsule biosynthesis